MSRDWLSTLFPASFNGVTFFIKDDAAGTGRRVHVAEFPGADDPFNEDLGRHAREIEIVGYLCGDLADVAMAALESACEIPGAGVLVMPAQGPLQARCKRIKRRRDRDRMGYFGFEAEFIREGGGLASAPPAFLAQATFIAVASVGAAAPAFLAARVTL